jgi:nucleoside phosphorylase/CheY-like chemotaxis protein
MSHRASLLIIEDDESRVAALLEAATTVPGFERDSSFVAGDVVEARRQLRSQRFDLVVLDMMLPTRSGQEPKPDAGTRLLDDIERGAGVLAPVHILGITGERDLVSAARERFGRSALTVMFVDDTSDDWLDAFSVRLRHAIAMKTAEPAEGSDDIGDRAFAAVVCALMEPELRAVRQLPFAWEQEVLRGDATSYFQGRFDSAGQSRTIVAAACNEMGMAHAAALTMKMINAFRPHYLFMVGICAGVKGKAGLGDVVAIDPCWDWGAGKFETTKDGVVFRPAPLQLRASTELRGLVRQLADDTGWAARTLENWQGSAQSGSPSVRIGPGATGAAVLANEKKLLEITGQQRQLLAVDMEAYGVMTACSEASRPRPECIVIKSVVDFGDTDKDDRAQAYGAYTSAQALSATLHRLCDRR